MRRSITSSSTAWSERRRRIDSYARAGRNGIAVAFRTGMLKLLGSIALARLLGFGILGFLVIYLLLSLLS